MKTSIRVLVTTLLFTGCGVDSDDPSDPEDINLEVSGGVPGTGCTIKAEIDSLGFGNHLAIGGVSCGENRHEEVQVCVEWLVTGGWQTPWCQDNGVIYGTTNTSSFSFNPHQFTPRWYRNRTWVSADGHAAAIYSNGQYLGGVSE